MFKSQIKKKTLSPKWHEAFDVVIHSRSVSRMTLEVFDWDRVGSDRLLGTGVVDLPSLVPFENASVVLPLVSTLKGSKGTIRVEMLFTPKYIVHSKKNGRAFAVAGRTLTSIGGAPLMVGKGVGHGLVAGGTGVAHGVGNIGHFAGRKVGRLTKKASWAGGLDDGQVGRRQSSFSSSGAGGGGELAAAAAAADGRTLSKKGSLASLGEMKFNLAVTCLQGEGIAGSATGDIKPYVSLQVGKKSHHTHPAKKSEEPQW